MLRHKRWAGHGTINGAFTNFATQGGGMYVHPTRVGPAGRNLMNEGTVVFAEGRVDFGAIGLRAIVHPTPGDYSFLLTHGVQMDKFMQALRCSPTSSIRVCYSGGYGVATYPHRTETTFFTDPIASDLSFNVNNAQHMTEATNRIGYVLLYNDNTRPGWSYADDDGSFLIKHKTKNMILVPEAGGQHNVPITQGTRLVWIACPTDCASDFNRDEYLTYGFLFENQAGQVCLPPGV